MGRRADGPREQKLKVRAKVLQKEELAKLASGWLQQGPKKSETRRASLPEKKKKTPKSAPKEGADEEEDGPTAPQEEDEDSNAPGGETVV